MVRRPPDSKRPDKLLARTARVGYGRYVRRGEVAEWGGQGPPVGQRRAAALLVGVAAEAAGGLDTIAAALDLTSQRLASGSLAARAAARFAGSLLGLQRQRRDEQPDQGGPESPPRSPLQALLCRFEAQWSADRPSTPLHSR